MLNIEPRSNPFAPADFLGLSQLPNVRLISLQVHDRASISSVNCPKGMKVETLGDDFDAGEDAFLDTAAVMEVFLILSSAPIPRSLILPALST